MFVVNIRESIRRVATATSGLATGSALGTTTLLLGGLEWLEGGQVGLDGRSDDITDVVVADTTAVVVIGDVVADVVGVGRGHLLVKVGIEHERLGRTRTIAAPAAHHVVVGNIGITIPARVRSTSAAAAARALEKNGRVERLGMAGAITAHVVVVATAVPIRVVAAVEVQYIYIVR